MLRRAREALPRGARDLTVHRERSPERPNGWIAPGSLPDPRTRDKPTNHRYRHAREGNRAPAKPPSAGAANVSTPRTSDEPPPHVPPTVAPPLSAAPDLSVSSRWWPDRTRPAEEVFTQWRFRRRVRNKFLRITEDSVSS